MRSLLALAAAMLLAVATPTLAIGDAEFAIRWDPTEGGLQTADEVLKALGLKRGKEKDFVVQYFTVNQPSSSAGEYKAIARERKAATGVDTTYKLRGSTSFPEAEPFRQWVCPLSIAAISKDEVDISWTGEAEPKRTYSRSCTAKADAVHAIPKKLGAEPLGCISKVRRTEIDGIKVEQWDLHSGKRLIEVSVNGQNNGIDLEKFQRGIVGPLLNFKVKPLNDSKTELGSGC